MTNIDEFKQHVTSFVRAHTHTHTFGNGICIPVHPTLSFKSLKYICRLISFLWAIWLLFISFDFVEWYEHQTMNEWMKNVTKDDDDDDDDVEDENLQSKNLHSNAIYILAFHHHFIWRRVVMLIHECLRNGVENRCALFAYLNLLHSLFDT